MASKFIDVHEHKGFLGAHFVSRQDEIVLRIGTREWTRTDLVQQIGISNIAAAGKLSQVLRKAKVTSIEDLYTIDPKELAMIKGLGETTVFVAMAILKNEGYEVATWYRSAVGARARNITFRTMKLHQIGRGKGKR